MPGASRRRQAAERAHSEGFWKGNFNAPVAMDVMARGIDISGVDLIIMKHVPLDIPQYVHALG